MVPFFTIIPVLFKKIYNYFNNMCNFFLRFGQIKYRVRTLDASRHKKRNRFSNFK